MIQAKCIQKFRDKQNKIYGYRIVDLIGNTKDVKAEDLKRAILNKQINIINLKLTSDNRLVDREEKSLTSKDTDKSLRESKMPITFSASGYVCNGEKAIIPLEEISDIEKNKQAAFNYAKKIISSIKKSSSLWDKETITKISYKNLPNINVPASISADLSNGACIIIEKGDKLRIAVNCDYSSSYSYVHTVEQAAKDLDSAIITINAVEKSNVLSVFEDLNIGFEVQDAYEDGSIFLVCTDFDELIDIYYKPDGTSFSINTEDLDGYYKGNIQTLDNTRESLKKAYDVIPEIIAKYDQEEKEQPKIYIKNGNVTL